jgi:hypothetical protein
VSAVILSAELLFDQAESTIRQKIDNSCKSGRGAERSMISTLAGQSWYLLARFARQHAALST